MAVKRERLEDLWILLKEYLSPETWTEIFSRMESTEVYYQDDIFRKVIERLDARADRDLKEPWTTKRSTNKEAGHAVR